MCCRCKSWTRASTAAVVVKKNERKIKLSANHLRTIKYIQVCSISTPYLAIHLLIRTVFIFVLSFYFLSFGFRSYLFMFTYSYWLKSIGIMFLLLFIRRFNYSSYSKYTWEWLSESSLLLWHSRLDWIGLDFLRTFSFPAISLLTLIIHFFSRPSAR